MRLVLVVEDDEQERKAVCELVSGEGIDVTSVDSADAAVDELEGRRFDCIVLDLKLGGEGGASGGFNLLEEVKTEEGHRGTPGNIQTGKALTARRGDRKSGG